MKLRNKKTRNVLAVESISLVVPTLVADKKIIQLTGTDAETGYRKMYRYKSLAELAEEWEDYEEPIQVYIEGIQNVFMSGGRVYIDYATAKEAELAVRKLKAWKRLKDFGCGFMIDDHFTVKFVGPDATKITSAEEQKSLSDAYKLLFGGEE